MTVIDVWVTVMHSVTDTTVTDFQRAEKVFAGVPVKFRVHKFVLSKDQTRAILGTDGKLATTGGPKEFEYDLPIGAGRSRKESVTVQSASGVFTKEVWAAIRNWTDLGGMHVFYVTEFDPPGSVGGLTLLGGVPVDPIILVSQKKNMEMLKYNGNTRGVLEHEIGHAFGLGHRFQAGTLMLDIVSVGAAGPNASPGTSLSSDELQSIRNSRLFKVGSVWGNPR